MKEQAISLRQSGQSIRSIASALKVSKSSVSIWVRDVIISDERKRELMARAGSAAQKKRDAKQKRILTWQKEAKEFFEQNKDNALFALGVGLYWGEGSKTHESLYLSNSDSNLIKVWVSWHKKFLLGLEFRCDIYAHEDCVKEDVIKFWAELLGISPDKIGWVISKPSSSKNKSQGKLPRGTCRIITGKGATQYHYKMMKWIELMGIG